MSRVNAIANLDIDLGGKCNGRHANCVLFVDKYKNPKTNNLRIGGSFIDGLGKDLGEFNASLIKNPKTGRTSLKDVDLVLEKELKELEKS